MKRLQKTKKILAVILSLVMIVSAFTFGPMDTSVYAAKKAT